MKKCLKCYNEMYDHEKVCVHCGAVQSELVKKNKLKMFFIWVLIMIAVCGINSFIQFHNKKDVNTDERLEESNEEIDNNNYNDDSSTNQDEDIIVEDEEDDEYYDNSYDTSEFFNISVTDLNKILSEKDDQKYFVLTASPYCSHCLDFIPKVNRSLENYEYAIEYIDMSKVTNEEINTIRQIRGFTSFGSTPIVFVVQNGIAIDSSIGNIDYYNYLKFIEKHGVQKKNNSDEIIIESVK